MLYFPIWYNQKSRTKLTFIEDKNQYRLFGMIDLNHLPYVHP